MKAVNLIPGEHRRARPSGAASGGAYAVIGGLAVLVALVVAYVLSANSLNDGETRAAEARQQADAYEAAAQQLGSFTDFAAIKEQRFASVVATAETRFDWERLMRELALVMPEGSWLQSADASVLGDTSDDAPSGTATIVATPSPTATLTGCTPKQSEVAKMMLRLEQMHRVTDVQLNQSERTEGASEVTVDSCGSLYQFDLTVSFAPVVATEAPRGASAVPAKLGGGS